MFNDFQKYVEENRLFNKNNKILLAVSGGMDSMAMSHLFLRGGYNIGIAHCNYCLRGEESDGDEEFVRKFADDNKIQFYSIRFDTKVYARKNGSSVQMAARKLRYDWFEKLRKEFYWDLTAVGHNMNDNIETLLINLTRGTGLAGLTGIKPASNQIVRPLLFASRQNINDYCKLNSLAFREDKSNLETKYTRNKIRHLIIPVLKEINSSVESTINEVSHRLSEINEILTFYIDNLRDQLAVINETSVSFRISGLKDHMKNRTVIFELFKPFGITSHTAEDLIKVIGGNPGGQVFTRTHRIIRDRDQLIITAVDKNPEIFIEISEISDLAECQFIKSAEILKAGPGFKISKERNIAELDFDLVTFPMCIRTWRSGDYFFPLGMNNKKKLSDYFIDRKYSIDRKEKSLLLESGGMIAWIIGERIDDRFKVKQTTSTVLRVEAW
jgi:tRNA(Ile)-lysidine synthase